MADEPNDDAARRYSRHAKRWQRKHQAKAAELQEAIDLLEAQQSQIEALTTEGQTAAERLAEIEAERQGQARRETFARLAKKANVKDEVLDDLMKLVELPEGDELDEKDASRAIREAVKQRPYMIAAAGPEGAGEGEPAAEGGTEGGEGEAPAAPLTKPAAETPPRLSPGEGHGRGARAPAKPPTIADVVNQDFAATGRTSAFRL